VGLLKEIAPRLSRIAIFGIRGLNATQFAVTETAAWRACYRIERRLGAHTYRPSNEEIRITSSRDQ
jgi:hypothetical protein